MDKQQRNVQVNRTTERRSPKNVRRLGRALIALAEAQLEAEAQAQAEAKGTHVNKTPPGTKPAGGANSPRPGGDAA